MSGADETAGAPQKVGESFEQLIDDLASGEDYWLSVTDAARVTRRQEITIRRWIAAGELPVRRQRMGLNKRTRHVRASDLATLTPIIDPTATITGAPANADLLSIPVQQAQLLTTQQELAQRLAPLEEEVAVLVEQRTIDHGRHEQHLQELRALRQDMLERLRSVQEEAQRQHQQTHDDFSTQMQVVRERLGELAEQFIQETKHRRTESQETAQSISILEAALQRMDKAVSAMHAQIEQEHQTLQKSLLEELILRQRQMEEMHAHLNDVIVRHLATAQRQWQQRMSHLEDQHATLQMAFIAEQQYRSRLMVHLRRLRASRNPRHLRQSTSQGEPDATPS